MRRVRYPGCMTKVLKAGDKVRWNTPQGATHGKVKRRLTSDTTVGGQKIAASADSPRYLVVSDKTGAEAAHKPEALERA
jgi:N-methylhydantoinase B/oxoprolinase/acetone carboxylase alpha subunit